MIDRNRFPRSLSLVQVRNSEPILTIASNYRTTGADNERDVDQLRFSRRRVFNQNKPAFLPLQASCYNQSMDVVVKVILGLALTQLENNPTLQPTSFCTTVLVSDFLDALDLGPTL
jgi:hypothetical protein